MTAAFHIAFNVGTAVLFIGLLDAMSRLLTWILPDRVREADPAHPRYLDETALGRRRWRSPMPPAKLYAWGPRRGHAA